jgi:hypothetical protein
MYVVSQIASQIVSQAAAPPGSHFAVVCLGGSNIVSCTDAARLRAIRALSLACVSAALAALNITELLFVQLCAFIAVTKPLSTEVACSSFCRPGSAQSDCTFPSLELHVMIGTANLRNARLADCL